MLPTFVDVGKSHEHSLFQNIEFARTNFDLGPRFKFGVFIQSDNHDL